jgi:hypothetical protein
MRKGPRYIAHRRDWTMRTLLFIAAILPVVSSSLCRQRINAGRCHSYMAALAS